MAPKQHTHHAVPVILPPAHALGRCEGHTTARRRPTHARHYYIQAFKMRRPIGCGRSPSLFPDVANALLLTLLPRRGCHLRVSGKVPAGVESRRRRGIYSRCLTEGRTGVTGRARVSRCLAVCAVSECLAATQGSLGPSDQVLRSGGSHEGNRF